MGVIRVLCDRLGCVMLTAATLWTITNIDDFVVLTVLFVQSAQSGTPRPGQIVTGQYLGSLLLIMISGGAAAGLMIVPNDWVGLLGVLPLTLGVYGLVRAWHYRDDDSPTWSLGVKSITAVVIANGGDNISVYTTVFRTLPYADTAVTIATFLVLVGVWCAAAQLSVTHTKVLTAVVNYIWWWLVPVVYITIGLLILLGSGVLVRLARTG